MQTSRQARLAGEDQKTRTGGNPLPDPAGDNRILNAAWRSTGTTGSERLLLVALCDLSRGKGFCWPSRTFLSEMIGTTKRNTRRLVAALKAKGLLVVEARPGRSSIYRPIPDASFTPDASVRPTWTPASATEDASGLPPRTPMSPITTKEPLGNHKNNHARGRALSSSPKDKPQIDSVEPELKLRGGSTFVIDASVRAEYVRQFPKLDVECEFGKMARWCQVNEDKRPAPKNAPGFILNWLERNEDSRREDEPKMTPQEIHAQRQIDEQIRQARVLQVDDAAEVEVAQ